MLPFIPAQYQFLAKFIVVMAVAGSGAFGAWYVTSDHYQAIIAQHELSDAAAVQAELQRQQKTLTDRAEQTRRAEEQHAIDQLSINRLGNQLAGVQVHLPKCGGAVPGAGQTGTNTNGASGVAAAGVDEYLDQAKRAIQDIGLRCATLNNAAIETNARNR